MADADGAAIVEGSSVASLKRTYTPKKAGLTFPIGRNLKRLKNRKDAKDVCVGASVYLSAILEYLAAELLELSGNEAKKEDTKIIVSSHMDQTVEHDRLLARLFERVNFTTDGAYDINSNEEEDEVSDGDNYCSDNVDEDEYKEEEQITCGCWGCVEDESDKDEESEMEDSEETCKHNSPEQEKSWRRPQDVGKMSIAGNRMELYGHLVDEFGEIVSPNLPKYKVEATSIALNGLLNLVAKMINITTEAVSIELVSEWQEMASFYASMGLKVEWLQNRVGRYRNWLSKKHSLVDVNELCEKLAAKQNELDTKREQVCILEKEVGELRTEIETVKVSRSQFGFSFFDE